MPKVAGVAAIKFPSSIAVWPKKPSENCTMELEKVRSMRATKTMEKT